LKILHIITGLSVGGAETALSRLVLSGNARSLMVVSLTTKGVLGENLIKQGVTVKELNLNSYNFISVIYKLYSLIYFYKPIIVQTWLYHADLIGGISAKLAGVRYIIWGIRTTELKKGSYLTSLIRKILAFLSYFIPSKIIVVAESAKIKHLKLGYDASKMHVISNGFNKQEFIVNNKSLDSLKNSLCIKKDDLIIGCVGRFSEVKGQVNFIKSAGIILKKFPDTKFLMVGRDLETNNKELTSIIEKYCSLKNFILLGERPDIAVCLKVMDIFCLPSRSEGFPNILGEAMLLGTPCVSTDAGDAAILGGHDVPIVKFNDIEGLASELIKMMNCSNKERKSIGLRLTNRIIEEYPIEKMVKAYNTVYETLISDS
jgi:glycosyltransferase involved in cell wall biosynthesis